jgi:thiosulfate dehydrogenase
MRVKTFLFGVIIGVALVAAGVYYYFASGMAPVATSAGAMPFEEMLASKALHARMGKEMPKTMPPWDEANLVQGAQLYKDHCAVCHGLPGQPESAISKGMFPRPPQLFVGKGVTDDPPAESYWKVEGGIRLTGMPAFSGALNDAQIWQVSLLVANANKLPDAAKTILESPPTPPAAKVPVKGK